MYAVKNWNEEVIKWLALAMCLAMLGMAVISIVGELKYGFVASEFGLAWSIGHGDVVGAVASGISLAAALASLAFMPETAPLWLIFLAY